MKNIHKKIVKQLDLDMPQVFGSDLTLSCLDKSLSFRHLLKHGSKHRFFKCCQSIFTNEKLCGHEITYHNNQQGIKNINKLLIELLNIY